MAVMAVEIRASLSVLAVLCSALAEHSHQGGRGLSCVNDFINNVSCTWQRSAAVAPGADCQVLCTKTSWDRGHLMKVTKKNLTESCELKRHHNATSGCSCVFRNEEFNAFSDLPCIRLVCSGALMEQLTHYSPYHHIKMHPPGVPNASSSANETRLWWSRGEPSSDSLTSLHFQLQIKQKSEWWNRSSSLITAEPELSFPAGRLTGVCRVRVRVRPVVPGSHWSDWSPTASFLGGADAVTPSRGQESLLGQTSIVLRGVMFSLGVVIVMLVLYRSCAIKRLLRGKPVPNPSTYFHSLHSEHGGNLKKWLNPPSASEPFFAAPPPDSFSPVDVCSTGAEGPSTSSTSSTFPSSGSSGSSGSTSALLPLGSHPSAGSNTSRVVDHSSSPSSSSSSTSSTSSSSCSSSSCFSNMGYFMSSSSGSSTRTDPNPAYFTYQEDFHNLHDRLSLRPSLHPSLHPFSTYESLKREPQSPDSGFGIGKDDEDKCVAVVVKDEGSDGDPDPPLLILPLHRHAKMCPTSSATPPLNTPTLISCQQVEVAVAAAGGGPAAWPPAGAVCRSSSMRVEPCRTGYLTLKELQATFSNKSI